MESRGRLLSQAEKKGREALTRDVEGRSQRLREDEERGEARWRAKVEFRN